MLQNECFNRVTYISSTSVGICSRHTTKKKGLQRLEKNKIVCNEIVFCNIKHLCNTFYLHDSLSYYIIINVTFCKKKETLRIFELRVLYILFNKCPTSYESNKLFVVAKCDSRERKYFGVLDARLDSITKKSIY